MNKYFTAVPKMGLGKKETIILNMLLELVEDTMQVFEFGAKKHPDSAATPNFLTPNGNKCSQMIRGNSCLHHAADVRAGVKRDHESGLHPALHLVSSAAILYIREKRNIVHPDDEHKRLNLRKGNQ